MKTVKLYYDEFIYTPEKSSFPIELMIGLMISIAFILMICCVLKTMFLKGIDHFLYFKSEGHALKPEEMQL